MTEAPRSGAKPVGASMPEGSPPTEKGERTRTRILDAALALFRTDGYDGTTMRAIARRADVSLGNAYYYFRSKEQLIQAFYGRTHEEHLAACGEVLDIERDFETRLLAVMRAKLATIHPYHRFAGVLFRTAADPASPLNPFSDESLPVRREATELFARVVRGSDERIPEDLEGILPDLLWLYHMGVILFWIHDSSPGCERSHRLMENSVGVVVRLVRLASHPLFRPVTRGVMRLLEDLGTSPFSRPAKTETTEASRRSDPGGEEDTEEGTDG